MPSLRAQIYNSVLLFCFVLIYAKPSDDEVYRDDIRNNIGHFSHNDRTDLRNQKIMKVVKQGRKRNSKRVKDNEGSEDDEESLPMKIDMRETVSGIKCVINGISSSRGNPQSFDLGKSKTEK